MPHLEVFWYRFNSIGAQKKVSKKVLPTFFLSISYVRTTETRLRILNLLSANPTKRSNTLTQTIRRQFADELFEDV